jgi:predicted acylesterase/phospholipase RssA
MKLYDDIIKNDINKILQNNLTLDNINLSIYNSKVNKQKLHTIINKTKLQTLKDKTKLVISGGGTIGGFILCGALAYLYDTNCLNNITHYAGSSVGSMLCVLLNIGYTPGEILEKILRIDLEKCQNLDCNQLITNYGLDNGEEILVEIRKLFIYKKINPNITLKELFDKTNKTLIITSTCLTEQQIYYLSYENFPDLSVIKAIRMSISIPFIFTAVEFDNKLFIDGGVINNCPISIFKDDLDSVIAINYVYPYIKIPVDNLEDFFYSFYKCICKFILVDQYDQYQPYLLNISGSTQYNCISFCFDLDEPFKLFYEGYTNIKKIF